MSKKVKDFCTRMKRTLTRAIKTKIAVHMHMGAVSVAEEDMDFGYCLPC